MSGQAKLKVENANYEKVFYYIEKMLSESDRYCSCARCRVDVAALALNTLPPHYFVDPKHAGNTDMGSPWILIEMAVREAMERVQANPHHLGASDAASEGRIIAFPPSIEPAAAEYPPGGGGGGDVACRPALELHPHLCRSTPTRSQYAYTGHVEQCGETGLHTFCPKLTRRSFISIQ
jgi:competence protein ComFB